MQQALLILHIFSALAIIGLVLVQQGKGADAGAAFGGGGGGGGASGSVFGSKGSASFLTKLTALFAVIFFSMSIFLAYEARNVTTKDSSVTDGIVSAPAVDKSNAIPEVTDDIKKSADKAVSGSAGIPEVEDTTEAMKKEIPSETKK